MRKTFKRSLAVLLTVLTLLSVVGTLGVFAAESDVEAVAAVADTEQVAAPAEEPVAAPAEEPVAAPAVESVAAPAEEAVAAPAAQPVGDPDPVVVGKVSNIEKTTFDTNSVGLKWKGAEGVTGYTISLRDIDKTTTFKKLADVTKTSCTIKNLPQAANLAINITAYKIVGGVRYEGNPVTKRTGTQPATPSGLTRVACGNRIEIKWNGNAKVTGYKVYRACAATKFQYVLYKTVTSPKLVDKNTKYGNSYLYKVNAYRTLSNGCTYTSTGKTIGTMRGLTTPKISVSSKLYRATVSWPKSPICNRYDVYYSTKSDSGYIKLGSTSGSSYVTKRLPGGKLYFRVFPNYVTNARTVTGTTVTKSANINNTIYGKTVGNTYVEVNIAKQRMWYYKNGKLIVETPVVTGNKNSMDTPKGYFTMYQRARNTTLVGPGYASPVDYWMAFSGGCGIHDATWRSDFGGNIYNGNGSHGCVNTPYNAVKTIYNNSGYGTPVIVY